MEERRKPYGQYGPYPPYEAYEEEDDIDIMEYVRKLLKNWKFIAKWAGIAAIAGVVMALSAVSTYTVTSKMAPETSSKPSTGGSLSSLASLAGINLGSMTSSDAISPELYPDIVSSTPFMTDLFYMPVKAKYKKEDIECNYYEYFLNCRKKTWYGVVMSIPGRIIGWCFSFLGPKEEKLPKGFKHIGMLDNSHLTRVQDKVLEKMRKSISVSVDKKTSVITVSVIDQDPLIAKQLTETVISKLKDYITKYRTEKSRQDLEYYEILYLKAQDEYFTAQKRYAAYSDANQGLIRQSVMIEQERLQNEMELKYQLYNSCAQQVQMAKAQVQRETPVVTTITPPAVPLEDNESGAKTLAIFVFLGVLFASIWVLFGEDFVGKIKNPEKEAE